MFIILQSGTSTAVLSLYRSTLFRLQCSKCLQTWTFMVVQSNWSWLPTILLLGFYVDVSERTIISAGTLRLRLSGLKSRAHLIRKYSFPSCQAQSSLHALSRLYVQKGFALSDIHSVLWPTNTSDDRPLCVGSTPVSKGFANFSVFLLFNFSILRQGVDPRVQRTHFFTALGVVWRQIRGAGIYIGSQISPTLSNLAVTLIERSWSSPYQEVLTQPNFHHLAIRHVDSCLVIVQKHHLYAPVFKVFTDLDFYGSPVELELVADNFTSRFLCWCFWKNNHVSRNPPIAFERTEESSSFNSYIFISVLSSTEFVARTISVICTERLHFVRYSQCVVADKYQRR